MSCLIKACPFPEEAEGLCRAHLCERKQQETAPVPAERPRIALLRTVADTVLLHGMPFRAKDKAPFIRSGKSVLGAIEYDALSKTVKCHECGAWHGWLPTHILHMHGLSAREYRQAHGLCGDNPLCAPEKSMQLRKIYTRTRRHGKIGPLRRGAADRVSALGVASRLQKKIFPSLSQETRNLRRVCPAQLLARLQELAQRLGHTPTGEELHAHGILRQTLMATFGSVAEAMHLAGLPSNPVGKHLPS